MCACVVITRPDIYARPRFDVEHPSHYKAGRSLSALATMFVLETSHAFFVLVARPRTVLSSQSIQNLRCQSTKNNTRQQKKCNAFLYYFKLDVIEKPHFCRDFVPSNLLRHNCDIGILLLREGEDGCPPPSR